MKGKYITTQIRITSLSQTTVNKKDIHEDVFTFSVVDRRRFLFGAVV